jgi:hypothetical protein
MENSRDADEPLSFEIGAGEITGNPLFQVRANWDKSSSNHTPHTAAAAAVNVLSLPSTQLGAVGPHAHEAARYQP